MTDAKQALLEDIQKHNGGKGFMLAAIEMKYATPNARGDFGNNGLPSALDELQKEGAIELKREKIGWDYFTRAHPVQKK